jgi:hypothetical protein
MMQKVVQMRFVFCTQMARIRKTDAKLYFLEEWNREMLFGSEGAEEGKGEERGDFSLMALMGGTGRASWKVVHWLGSKFTQTEDIQELKLNVQ